MDFIYLLRSFVLFIFFSFGSWNLGFRSLRNHDLDRKIRIVVPWGNHDPDNHGVSHRWDNDSNRKSNFLAMVVNVHKLNTEHESNTLQDTSWEMNFEKISAAWDYETRGPERIRWRRKELKGTFSLLEFGQFFRSYSDYIHGTFLWKQHRLLTVV